jgi:HK97 gp10 family phage protein
MTTTGKLSTKGFEEFLERLSEAGKNVDDAADKALQAGAEVALEIMQRKVAVLTGNLQAHLKVTPPEAEGNYHFIKVGLLTGKTDAATARYGNAQEFGSSSMPAHPFVRPAFAEGRAKIRAAMRDSLKESLA